MNEPRTSDARDNPYKSPTDDSQAVPLYRALPYACHRAVRAYWKEIRRQRITPAEHVQAWVTLLILPILAMAVLFMAFVIACGILGVNPFN